MSSTRSRGRRLPVARLARLALGGLALAGAVTACDARHVLTLGAPAPVTDKARNVQGLYVGSVIAALAVGAFVWGLMFWAMAVYRKRSDQVPRQVRYNLPIEVLYTVVPFVVISVLFYYTVVSESFVDKLTSKPAVRIGVVGFQWNWQFNYLGDNVSVTGHPGEPAQLVLPTHRTIRFSETSPDVVHSFWVPAFLFKRDVIPGRQNQFELTIDKEGTYVGRCAELCGVDHDRMYFSVKAVPPPQYDAFMARMKSAGSS